MGTILITGAAGFIGTNLAKSLASRGQAVVALDSVDAASEAGLKRERVEILKQISGISLVRADIGDRDALLGVFREWRPSTVYHLAANAGLRRHFAHPERFIAETVVGFQNILDCARLAECEHLLLSSSSSVYEANGNEPSEESEPANRPLSVYAASKRNGELMAHAYAHRYGLRVTAARLFSIYGPWGRSDMAPMLFTHKILRGEVLTLQDPTRIRRDFTYVADAVESLRLLADAPADEPWRAVNVGTGVSHTVMELVTVLESLIGKKAKTVVEAKPAFEAESTRASTDKLVRITGQKPSTSLADGLAQMVRWALERERQAAAAPRGPKAQAETRAETRGDAEFAEHLSSQFA